MFNSLLDIVLHDDGKYYFNNYGEPFIYALIGLLIVFAGLVVIITIIWLIGFVMRKTENLTFFKKSERKEKSESEELPSPAADEIPDEVKAAIIAAIMAYCEKSKPGCEFKVKRIKKL